MNGTDKGTSPDWFPEESRAAWITCPVLGGPRTCPPAVYYRGTFHLGGVSGKRFFLQITALGLFEAECNGQRVDEVVFSPGWTDYSKRVYYRTIDVTASCRFGENVLGIILGDGWYSGHIAEKNRQYYGEQPAVLAVIVELSEGDGVGREVQTTGADWWYAVGPILENDLVMGETYDARRELGAWSQPGKLEEPWRWHPVLLGAGYGGIVERSKGPPVRRMQYLEAQSLPGGEDVPWRPCIRRFDFKQNIAGRIRLRVRGKRGTHLRIRHAEFIRPDGSLYLANLRDARATDHYTLKGVGLEEWEPRFTYHGFRYVEIFWRGLAEEIGLLEVQAVVLHSEIPRTGSFSCSHPLLNQLSSNIEWSLKGNFLEVPTDCPQRDERLGWTGDAQAFARTATFYGDVRLFFHKWLQDMRDAQQPDGSIPATIPYTHWNVFPVDGGPAWADAVFICPWTLYQAYGDEELLRKHYGCMAGYFDYLTQWKVKEHIRSHPEMDAWGGFGDWLALDGSGRMEGGTPKDLIGTAYYAHGAEIMARSAGLLGKMDDALRYKEVREQIVRAFQKRFWDEKGSGRVATQTACVLALHFDLVPQGARKEAVAMLVDLIEKNGNRIGTGFVGTPYLLHVLEKAGRLDVAYRLLEQEAFPSWLFPVKNGATTIWERWDGWTPEKGFQDAGMNSFNHYAYGAVGDWMVSALAGLEIDFAAVGQEIIHFKPRPGGSLRWAKAVLQAPQGEVGVEWKKEGNRLWIELLVPEGAMASLTLPPECGGTRHHFGGGRHRSEFAFLDLIDPPREAIGLTL